MNFGPVVRFQNLGEVSHEHVLFVGVVVVAPAKTRVSKVLHLPRNLQSEVHGVPRACALSRVSRYGHSHMFALMRVLSCVCSDLCVLMCFLSCVRSHNF